MVAFAKSNGASAALLEWPLARPPSDMRLPNRASAAVFALIGSATILLPAILLGQSAPTSKGEADFRFKELNHPYQDILPPLAPVAQGPLTIQLNSPHQTLDLIDNEVHAHPNGDGTHELTVDLMVAGRGELIAKMSLADMTRTIHDQVELPRQSKTVEATVRIRSAAGAYEITTVRLPSQVTLAIRSGVGDRIIGWCNRMALIPFFALDCDGLTQSLQTAVIPLPPPGSTYELPYDQLTPDEKAQIDAYLSTSGTAAMPAAGRQP